MCKRRSSYEHGKYKSDQYGMEMGIVGQLHLGGNLLVMTVKQPAGQATTSLITACKQSQDVYRW